MLDNNREIPKPGTNLCTKAKLPVSTPRRIALKAAISIRSPHTSRQGGIFSSPSSQSCSVGASPYIDEPEGQPRKSHSGLKAVLITLSVIILIAASAVAFFDPSEGIIGFAVSNSN
jgi:hypothetical protein